MQRQSLSAKVVIAVALLCAAAVPTQAAIVTSAATGNWGVGATWVGGAVPQPNDDVVIAAGHTVTINVGPPVLTTITVNNTGILRNDAVAGRILQTTANATVAAGGAINFSLGTGTITLNVGGALNNSGTVNMGTVGTLMVNGGTSNLIAAANITTNLAATFTGPFSNAGTYTHAGAGTVLVMGGFTNGGAAAGTFTYSGTGPVTVNGGFNNSMATSVVTQSAANALTITGGMANAGTWTVSAQANVSVDPNLTNTGTVNFSYQGAVACSLVVTGDLSAGAAPTNAFTMNAHGLRVGGNLTNAGVFTKAYNNAATRPIRVTGKLVNTYRFFVTTTGTNYCMVVGDTLRNEDSMVVAGVTTKADTVGSLVNNRRLTYTDQGLVVWRASGTANFDNSAPNGVYLRNGGGYTTVLNDHTNAGLDSIGSAVANGGGNFTVGGTLTNTGRFRAIHNAATVCDISAAQLSNSGTMFVTVHGLLISGNFVNAGTFTKVANANDRLMRITGNLTNAGGGRVYIDAANAGCRLMVYGTLMNNDSMHVVGAASAGDTIGTLNNYGQLAYNAESLCVTGNFNNGAGAAVRFRRTGNGRIRVGGNLTNDSKLYFTAGGGRLIVAGTFTNNDYDSVVGANTNWDSVGTLVNNSRIVYQYQQVQVGAGGFTNAAAGTYLRLSGTNTTNMTRVAGDLMNDGVLQFRSATAGRFVVLGTFTNTTTGYDSVAGFGGWDTVGILVNNARMVYGNQLLQVNTSFTNGAGAVYQRLATTNVTRVGDAAGTGDVLNNGRMLFNQAAGRFCAFGTLTNNDSINMVGAAALDTFGNVINNKWMTYVAESVRVTGNFNNNAPNGNFTRSGAGAMLVLGNLTNDRILNLAAGGRLRVNGILTNNDSMAHTAAADSAMTRFVNGASARYWAQLIPTYSAGDIENAGFIQKNTGTLIALDSFINSGRDTIVGNGPQTVGTLVNSGSIWNGLAGTGPVFTVRQGGGVNSGVFRNFGASSQFIDTGDFTNSGTFRDTFGSRFEVRGDFTNTSTGTFTNPYTNTRFFGGDVTNNQATVASFDLNHSAVTFNLRGNADVASVVQFRCSLATVDKLAADSTLTFTTPLKVNTTLNVGRGTMVMDGANLWVDTSTAIGGNVRGTPATAMQGRLRILNGAQADIRLLDQTNLNGVGRFEVGGTGTLVNIDSMHTMNVLSPAPAPVCSIYGGSVYYKGSGSTITSSLYLLPIGGGTEGGWYATGGDVYFPGNIYAAGTTRFWATSGATLHFTGATARTVNFNSGSAITGSTFWSMGNLRDEKSGAGLLTLMATNSLGPNNVEAAGIYTGPGAILQLGTTFTAGFGYDVNGNIQNNGSITRSGTPTDQISVSGDWMGAFGSFSHGNRPVYFDGTGTSLIQLSSPFYDLYIAKAGGAARLENNQTVQRFLTINSGTFDVNRKTLTMGTGSAAGTITVSGSGATFSAVGDAPGPNATVTAASLTWPYAFSVQSGGKLAALYTTFERMGSNGITIAGGAQLDATNNLSGCTFDNGSASGPMLTLNTNQTLNDLRYVNFNTTAQAAQFNIRKALNQGHVRVRGGSGSRWGEAFDDDPNDSVDWWFEHDVRCSDITVPTGSLDSGVLIAPACSVDNQGLVNETYWVHMRIGTVYNDSALVTGHASDTKQEVLFPAYSAWPRGFGLAVACSTALVGDEDGSDDKRIGTIDIHVHDAAAQAFGVPANGGAIAPGTALDPTGTMHNSSNVVSDVPAQLEFGTGPTAYLGSGTATSVPVGGNGSVSFPTTPALAAGYYTMKLKAVMPGDIVPANDSILGEFLVIGTPQNLIPDNDSVNTRNVALDWDDLATAETYTVQVDNNSDFSSPEYSASGLTASAATTTALADGQYWWRVRGVSHSISGDWSASGWFELDATAPSAPGLVYPTPGATHIVRQPTFEWTGVTFAGGKPNPGTDLVVHYDIELARDAGFTDIVFSNETGGLTYLCPSTLDYATPYWWRVRGTDDFTNVGFWGTGDFTTIGTAAPVLVEPVNAARLNDPTPYFDWNPSADADYYQLHVSLYSDFHELSIDIEQAETDFTPVAPLGDGHYYWRARSSANTGLSYGDWSAVWEFDLDATPPAAPALVYPGPNGSNLPVRPTFDWSDVSLQAKAGRSAAKGQQDVLDYYDIEVATNPGFTPLLFSAQPTTSEYTWTGDLEYTTRYYWRVRGTDDFGNTGAWARDSFMTQVVAPAVPLLETPANNAVYVVVTGSLVWHQAAGAAEYDIYLGTANPPTTLLAEHVTDTTAAYVGLPPGTVHYWQVVARNAGGTAQSAVWTFTTGSGMPTGWSPKRDTLTGSAVKDGGSLAYDPNEKYVYALKGGKTFEFHRYRPADSTWAVMPNVPPGPTLRQVSKGAALCYGSGYAYVMKGNGTREFYRFRTADRSWDTTLQWIPLAMDQSATRGKPVKAGGGLAYVNKQDTAEYVYVLKGYGTDFYKYDILRDTFYSLTATPYKTKAKYDKGSWIVYDGTQYLYVMQAKYNALFRYDVTTESWDGALLDGMPFNSTVTGKSNKKVGDGSCAAWEGTAIYALKGNNTQEYWKYVPGVNDSWTELESIPQSYGSGAKKKKVKSGAGIVFYPETGVFFAHKGNKCNQLWAYTPGGTPVYATRPNRDGVTATGLSIDDCRLTLAPNPLVSGYVTVRYSLPRAGTASLSIFDVTGRTVMTRMLTTNRTQATGLDLRGLAAGVYLVKLSSDGFAASQKLVIER